MSHRPNLHKPLPRGPPIVRTKVSNSSARRTPRRGESLDSATLFRSSDEAAELPTRFESLRKQSRSVSATSVQGSKASSTSPRGNSRGERLGRSIPHANTAAHVRAKSESLLSPVDDLQLKAERTSGPTGKPNKVQARRPLNRHAKQAISSRTAEQVIYRIMTCVDNPKDLQSAAMVSKGFLNTYQRNESKLISHLIFQTSRPAWELRRSLANLKGSRTFRMREYQRDLRTIQALRALIADRCSFSCKTKTIAGLLGRDKSCEWEVENALWRIWTFCALFGDNACQAPVPTVELDWLNGSKGAKSHILGAGFAVGNGNGLTVDELEDISEMWCCLQNLAAQFHAREEDAKRTGVFDNWHLHGGASAHQHVVEWTAYILTLGPQVILSLSSGSFDRAKVLGLTQWKAPPQGQTRSGFLMTALSQVYQERLLAEATAKAALVTLPTKHRPSKSMPNPSHLFIAPNLVQESRQPSLRIDTQSLHYRATKRRPISTSAAPRTASNPIQIRPDCDPANDQAPFSAMPRMMHTRSVSTSAVTTTSTTTAFFPASPTADPTVYHALNLTAPANTASVKLGATLFPMEYTPNTPRVPLLASPPPPSRAPPPIPTVRDPIDKAMDLLVNEFGFRESNVKRALAMSDSGSGIDIERAIELLAIESRREAMATAAPIELPTPADIVSPLSQTSSRRSKSRRDFCDGGCKHPTTSSGNSVVSTKNSLRRSTTGSIATAHRHIQSTNRNYLDTPLEEGEDGNLSPITDIYGGHSDEETIDDDSSEMWRRREGNDTISPLITPMPNVKNVSRMSSQSYSQKKAWKVLGVPSQAQQSQNGDGTRGPAAGLKGGLARMRSKSSGGVVGMEEYALRVERKKSMRMVQEAGKKGGVVSAALSEQLKGLGLGAGVESVRMSGGLGGLRVLHTEVPQETGTSSESEGRVRKGKQKERWSLKKSLTASGRKEVSGCIPASPC